MTRFPLQHLIAGATGQRLPPEKGSSRFPFLSGLPPGAIAKRLCNGLQIRLARFDSGSRLQLFIPIATPRTGPPRPATMGDAGPGGEMGRHSGLKICFVKSFLLELPSQKVNSDNSLRASEL